MFKLRTFSRFVKLGLPLLLMASFSQIGLCQEPLVIFLVRHAEKVDNSNDPPLSPTGNARANTLARRLADAKIQYLHSTDYIRTKKTASPLAEKSSLKVDLYNAGDLPALVKKLKGQGGRHLVVGHSNTTPKLVKLLGGEAGSKIYDKEYDRLYILTFFKNEAISTVMMRYGDPFESIYQR